ncbi:PREDICTED: protein-glutamine gamma-glutamyltransferase E-like [Nanorana parkeri]|uniref:protein-glutamine gamma-glutamyltransferase E-like n=1 Tax=Nanorana parkeri TaxID=125878 RepID=UPI0008542098|nr:PREDICTED: protein-glutamine gamma-glutamyltransferase E-like [Nanorana parkeri]
MMDLQVISYDSYPIANKTNHHTNAYDCSDPIFRRGQPFTMTLNFNRPLQSGENVILIFEIGPNPSESSRTKAVIRLFGARNQSSWSAVLSSSSSNNITVTINSPSDAVIGQYIMSFVGNSGTPQPICGLYLLFNPWDQEDDVFLADESERQEYVLNDKGVIFMGSEYSILPLSWGYDEFDRSVLEICLAIMDRSVNHQHDPALDVAQRNDPLYVCRVVHGTLNSKDENGVLVENWSGIYDDGISPSSWNGSSVILKDWYLKGFKPVKYGQCWVYGGLLCTVLRCLGIPTRVITNFNSAHDKNANLFLDMFYDNHGTANVSQQDAIWNFHVWNEAWFTRKDLGPAYNGWQVMDSTPMELSEGLYRCGPAPLVAIRQGDVDLRYDVGFMFASVNADLTLWITSSDGTKKRVSNDTKYIGKYISTKAVGSDDRVDVTHMYKYPEGSVEERAIVDKALEKKMLLFKRKAEQKPQEGTGLHGGFSLLQRPTLGQDIDMILSLKNTTSTSIKVVMNMTSSSILYTGKLKHEIWADAKALPLTPNEEKLIAITLTYAQYGKYVSEDNVIRMIALCEVEGTEERILMEMDVIFAKLSISVQVPQHIVINIAVNANVTITNTLAETMNSCSVLLEGSGLLNGVLQAELPALKPGEKAQVTFLLSPSRIGNRTLTVTLNSDKIKNVKRSYQVFVAGAR